MRYCRYGLTFKSLQRLVINIENLQQHMAKPDENSTNQLLSPKRTGARKTSEIPIHVLEQLNNGKIETANLVEWLAVDQRILLNQLLIQYHRTIYLAPILQGIDQLKKQTVNTINEAIGTGILEQTIQHNDSAFYQIMAVHQADLVRCWAAYSVGKNTSLSIADTLKQIQQFAADAHFGVREISWLAVREKISSNLEESIAILSTWAVSNNEHIRRFASESTRPRGVWCTHIEVLKRTPMLALPILNALKSDPSRYVQNSVANWLNDASKTCPIFVQDLYDRWSRESNTKATTYILKRAIRSLHVDNR